MQAKSKYVRKTDITSIPKLKNNPITTILVRKYTVRNKVDITKMINDLTTFVNSTDTESKLHFLFSIYDMDKDGYISNIELYEILKLLNKNILENWKLQNIVDRTFAETETYTTTISYDQFKFIIAKNNKNIPKLEPKIPTITASFLFNLYLYPI